MRLLTYSILALIFASSCAHKQAHKDMVTTTTTEYHDYEHEHESLLKPFYATDPTIKKYVRKSVGYVIYPRIEKGAVGIGGAFGKGNVYEKLAHAYKLIGHSELTQLSAGLQLGGQSYSEIIFFENKKAFNKFKRGEIQLGAQASVVALKKGASANAVFKNGVAIVILKEKGLMGELSVGGQKLTFVPLHKK